MVVKTLKITLFLVHVVIQQMHQSACRMARAVSVALAENAARGASAPPRARVIMINVPLFNYYSNEPFFL